MTLALIGLVLAITIVGIACLGAWALVCHMIKHDVDFDKLIEQ